MMKSILLIVLIAVTISGLDIPIAEVEKRIFREVIEVNSKIVQRSDAKESVMARLGGKVKMYFVQEGEAVKKGQKIATIESLELSSLSSKLKLLRQQLVVHNKNFKMLKNLYNSGLETAQNVNKEQRERDETASHIESVKKQLALMGVSSEGMIKSTYTLYAGSSGTVSRILTATNAVVNSNTPLVSIVKGSKAILLKSFIPLRYAPFLHINQKVVMNYAGQEYKAQVSQILPELDNQTQQIVLLSSLDEEVKNLFVNAFVGSKIYIGEAKSYLSVKKTALNFFNNEWVVFVPVHQEEEEHGKHEGNGHEEHDEASHAEQEEDKEVPYALQVVKILKQNEVYVAIEGLEEHQAYVSDKAYHVKSLLLKSSLGGHGH